jgi:hypothetical protein
MADGPGRCTGWFLECRMGDFGPGSSDNCSTASEFLVFRDRASLVHAISLKAVTHDA